MMVKLITVISIFFATYVQSETLEEKISARKAQSASKMDPKIKAEFERAINELRASGIEQKAVQNGVQVPQFFLAGKSISEHLGNGPLILKFYRGGWCPYCMMELQEYEKYQKEFKKQGATLIFLTPDTKKEISKTKKKFKLSLEIHQDKNNGIAKKFGLAFKLDKKVSELYKKFGINLEKSQENTFNELPMPGTYIINKKGKVIYAFADADYTKRVGPRALLKEFAGK